MSVYTYPDSGNIPDNAFAGHAAPTLLFKKWQVWDDFDKFDRKESRLRYLQQIADAVDKTSEKQYTGWYDRYSSIIKDIGADILPFETQWRLIVGWGDNPTMESGLTLHHLYGFPYIPGSAVKGMLHHFAEMESMTLIADSKFFKLDHPEAAPPPPWLPSFMLALEKIRLLFGSVHLEKHKVKNTDNPKTETEVGPDCPRFLLKNLLTKLSKAETLSDSWKNIKQTIQNLIDQHTGGILRFYDAVPRDYQPQLLQPDIVNVHYQKYYESEGKTAPSDDLSPVPVTFLAVRPQANFIFPFRLEEQLLDPPRDKEEIERAELLKRLPTSPSLSDLVKDWFETALSEWGIGAKTAAGYGYFKTGVSTNSQDKTATSGKQPKKVTGNTDPEKSPRPEITPSEPPQFNSSINPKAKAKGISSKHGLEIWKKLAENEYIERIEGGDISARDPGTLLPRHEISTGGRKMELLYQSGRFFCPVRLTLQGINSEEEAQWLWETLLRPALAGEEEKR